MIGALGIVGLVVGSPSSHGRGDLMGADDQDVAHLVGRAQRNERAAYASLYERFRRAVHAAVLARAPFGDADDVVQETFLTAWRKLDTLSDPAAFGGWILQIARRTAVDHRRRVRPREELADDARSHEDPPITEAREVLAVLVAMPEAYRETLLMRLVEGMTGPEIAEATGLEADSVRVNLCRGMKLLRAKLEGEENT